MDPALVGADLEKYDRGYCVCEENWKGQTDYIDGTGYDCTIYMPLIIHYWLVNGFIFSFNAIYTLSVIKTYIGIHGMDKFKANRQMKLFSLNIIVSGECKDEGEGGVV